MEHLPPPIGDVSHDDLKVHFFAPLSKHDVYSPQHFFTIPKEYGYDDFEDFCENGFGSMEPRMANELLQAWLWFSLIAQVTGAPVYAQEFLRPGDHTLHSNKLKSIILEWREREKIEGAKDYHHMQTSNYVRASIAIGVARRFITKHCSHERMDREDRSQTQDGQMQDKSQCPYLDCSVKQGLDTKLTLSLAILGETLELERPLLSSDLDGRVQFHYEQTVQARKWGKSTYCREMWRKNEWCPFEIRRMEATFTRNRCAYLICHIKPPTANIDHSKCSIRGCVASRSVETTLHMNGCTGCTHRHRLDEAELVRAIEREPPEAPLVMLTEAEEMKIEYVDLRKTEIVFVALTHSWEDGIFENGKDARGKNDRSICHCQMKRAQDTANQLLKDEKDPNSPKEVYLWIDVLCFPRESSARAPAINQMKDIYSKAAAVLVWDRALLNTPKSHPIEMNLRIRMSKWAQRLWTLQEAVLAKPEGLHVQFQNGTIGIKDLGEARDAAKGDSHHAYHFIWKAGHPFSSAIAKLRQGLDKHAVSRAWEAIQFRSSTAPQDETLVLANVLRLNVVVLEKIGSTLEEPEVVATKRMVKFLEMLDEKRGLGIPSGIIFLAPPKLSYEGYGWAPKTWLTKQAATYPLMRAMRETGTIMKKGLLVEFPGIILHCPQAQVSECIFWVPVCQSLTVWYKVRVDRGGKGRDFADFWENHVCKYSQPSIIMTEASPKERWELGILVQTLGSLCNGDIRWVRTLCRVWIRLETNSKKHSQLADDFRMKPKAMLFGEKLKSQKWCVDGESV